jgi:hypothetical protein
VLQMDWSFAEMEWLMDKVVEKFLSRIELNCICRDGYSEAQRRIHGS